MNYPEIELISHVLCPYVQRSVITLNEKEIGYVRKDIDLNDKPRWFLQLSPTGKVPMLLTDGQPPLFESAVICEYLDEITPGNLHPESSWHKAHHRSWIEFGSGILNQISAWYRAENQQAFEQAQALLRQKFEMLDKQLTAGPFFGGERFHLIDAVYGPIFRYFDVCETVMDLELFTDLPKINRWRNALSQRPSVKEAVTADYSDRLITFLRERNSYLSSLL